MKTYGRLDVYIHVLELGGEWSALHPGRFTLGTHCIGGWVGPSTNRKIKNTGTIYSSTHNTLGR
jgi:hypothetical protein